MHSRTLFHYLTGIDPSVKFPERSPLTPDSINHFCLREGHMIEYYRIGPEKKRIVVFFWKKDEWVLPSHRYHSRFEPLDEISKMTINYGGMIMALRSFPAFVHCYRRIQWEYGQKVGARLYALSRLSPKERLAQLEQEDPWVFDLVSEEDIANYLRLNVGILRRLTLI